MGYPSSIYNGHIFKYTCLNCNKSNFMHYAAIGVDRLTKWHYEQVPNWCKQGRCFKENETELPKQYKNKPYCGLSIEQLIAMDTPKLEALSLSPVAAGEGDQNGK